VPILETNTKDEQSFAWLHFVMKGLLINHYVPYEQHPTTKQQCNTQVQVNFLSNFYHDLYVNFFSFCLKFFNEQANFGLI
jgi:hypothetical protein